MFEDIFVGSLSHLCGGIHEGRIYFLADMVIFALQRLSPQC